MNKICIIGSDPRSNYIRNMYVKEGIKPVDYIQADIVIAPIPFSRDGVKITGENIDIDTFLNDIKGKILFSGTFLDSVKEKLQDVKYYDLMEEDSIAILNSIPTAEGAIFEAIKNSDTTLCGSNCLVMGYGRIGKVLSKMLKGIGANVFCEARKNKDLAFIQAMGYNKVDIKELNNVLKDMDYIFNTVPAFLLDKSRLKMLKKDVLVVDLASTPGGVDFEAAKSLDLNVVWALSLPSKVAPKTAAIYLKEAIDDILATNLK